MDVYCIVKLYSIYIKTVLQNLQNALYPTDKAYKVEYDAFENKRAVDFMEVALDFILVLDEDEAEQEKRNDRMVRYGFACSEADRVDCYLLSGSDEEIQGRVKALSDELMRLSTATAKEVRKQEEGFRPEVDGDVSDGTGDAHEQPDHPAEQEDVPVS